MAKLSLTANPTFKAKVGIPVPGNKAAQVEFVFNHKTRDQIREWLNDEDTSHGEQLMHIACGWDLDDAFNLENAEKLCNQYPGAANAIYAAFLEELRGARAKN